MDPTVGSERGYPEALDHDLPIIASALANHSGLKFRDQPTACEKKTMLTMRRKKRQPRIRIAQAILENSPEIKEALRERGPVSKACSQGRLDHVYKAPEETGPRDSGIDFSQLVL